VFGGDKADNSMSNQASIPMAQIKKQNDITSFDQDNNTLDSARNALSNRDLDHGNNV